MKKAIAFVSALTLALVLAGCGGTPRTSLPARAAVTYAVAKGIEQGWDAKEVVRIATLAKEAATGQAFTVEALQELAATQIAGLDLSPADRALAGVLVQSVVEELRARLDDGPLDAERAVKIAEVLQWVIDAADSGFGAGFNGGMQ